MPPITKPSILKETKDFLIISKPRLMHSDKNPNSKNYSVAEWLGERGTLLNRLDFETSGILVAAKTDAFAIFFKEATKKKLVKKSYLAYVEGIFKEPIKQTIYIGSSGRSSPTVRVFEKNRPKYRTQSAYTEFYPHKVDDDNDRSYVRAIIFEGKRHQIRAHAAWLGHPLVGDKKYGSSVDDFTFILHGIAIEFPDRLNAKKILKFRCEHE